MAYFTVLSPGIYSFEEKKSKFIGRVLRVETEEEAKQFINDVKKDNPEARHNVYAYVIGENMGIQRYSDDGEPQGTGGIPALEVIKKNNLTDCAVVVTRYFGGILLGTGGLTRAYSRAASEAVKKAGIVEKVIGVSIEITLGYDILEKFKYYCKQNEWFIEDIKYSDKVCLLFYCEKVKKSKFKEFVMNITSGKCNIKEYEENFYFKMNNRLYKKVIDKNY